MKPSNVESPLWQLFIRLRRRRFIIGIDDYRALREALRAGYGWSSRESLRNLCCTLWAKSKQECEVVASLFDQLELPNWELEERSSLNMLSVTQEPTAAAVDARDQEDDLPPSELSEPKLDIKPNIPATLPSRGLPPITVDDALLPTKSFIFIPHFSLTRREAAHLGGYLRKTTASRFLEDIDVNATINLRSQQGILRSIVLQSRRRNTPVILLVDRQGSMTPFHQFSDIVCDALSNSDCVGRVATYYFHDVVAEGPDYRELSLVREELSPILESLWGVVPPVKGGYMFEDRELLLPILVRDVLQSITSNSIVILLSDAGAARRHFDPQRLLDTVGFIKALRLHTNRYIFLNPLPQTRWVGTTAADIAQYIPMFPLDLAGINHAVRNLRV